MKPRPRHKDPEVIEMAALEALPLLRQYLNDESEDYTKEELMKQLRETLKGFNVDGYDRAKEWEALYHYCPDTELVEFLDSLDTDRAYRKAVRQWVADYQPTTKFNKGDLVLVAGLEGLVEGEITGFYEEEATALVCCESLGHVRDGLGTHGLIIPYESLRALMDEINLYWTGRDNVLSTP